MEEGVYSGTLNEVLGGGKQTSKGRSSNGEWRKADLAEPIGGGDLYRSKTHFLSERKGTRQSHDQ